MTQVISRLCQYRAVTLLEVSTTAYVLCAVTAYAAWWKNPQSCVIPVIISCTDEALPKEPESDYSATAGTWWEFLWGGRDWGATAQSMSTQSSPRTWVVILCPTIYGAIHAASWNIALPSEPELWIWRGSTLFCLIFGLLLALLNSVGIYENWLDRGTESMLVMSTVLYFVVRTYMIVQVFISLRALPRSAYDSAQWSNFVPHI